MVKNPPANTGDLGLSQGREVPWSRQWQPTPVFLSGKFHGQRSLASYSQWGRIRPSHCVHTLTLNLTLPKGWLEEGRTPGSSLWESWETTGGQKTLFRHIPTLMHLSPSEQRRTIHLRGTSELPKWHYYTLPKKTRGPERWPDRVLWWSLAQSQVTRLGADAHSRDHLLLSPAGHSPHRLS